MLILCDYCVHYDDCDEVTAWDLEFYWRFLVSAFLPPALCAKLQLLYQPVWRMRTLSSQSHTKAGSATKKFALTGGSVRPATLWKLAWASPETDLPSTKIR